MRYLLSNRSLILLLALFLGFTHGLPAAAASSQDSEQPTRFLYREFREVKSFGMIAVSLVGQAEQLGLKTDEIAEYARAKFREYFSGVRLDDVSGDSKKFLALVLSRDKTVGNITFRIWVLGEEYPIVYHVKCDAGNFNNPSIWSEESLGHESKAKLQETILGMVDEMMKTLAVAFFKVKAQEM